MVLIFLINSGHGQCLDSEAIDAACISLFKSGYSVWTLTGENCCYKNAEVSSWWNAHYMIHGNMSTYNLAFYGHIEPRRDCIDITRINEYDKLFLPFHVPGHWILFVCSIKRRKIELYDSLWSIRRSGLAAIFVVPYLNSFFGFSADEQWEIVNHGYSSPQQSNGVDCGIFVIHTLLCIVRGEPSVTPPPANFRSTVLSWILG